MSEPLRFKLVDAFTSSSYAGNVAGVVFDADALTDRQMQLIAAEFNASETTFILNPTVRDAALRFRWFTPGCEVNFCGHATIGAFHAVIEDGHFAGAFDEPGTIIPIETRSGIVTLRLERSRDPAQVVTIWFDAPHNEPKKTPVNLSPLLPHLGITMDLVDPRFKPIRTHDDDIIFAITSLPVLLQMQPSMSGLIEYCRRAGGLRGIFITCFETLSAAVAAQSRFFAPNAGVDEDPVTGSAHGPFGLQLVQCGIVPTIDGRADFLCAQGKSGGRAGLVRVVVSEEPGEDGAIQRKVRIGGNCVTTASGILNRLPADPASGRLYKGC
ncbi:MAG: PhzF family phenazine biosynthesis protein [Phycisphaerae bacterium]|nr:PhzF family phenazine biosynthesis protein [Phycisphaerae bacterium]